MERPCVPSLFTPSGTKGRSCFPPGTYRLTKHSSEAFPNVWALVNPLLDVYHQPNDVPKDKKEFARTAVLIHAANWAFELRGCIAPGKTRQRTSGQWMVTRSRDALNELRNAIGSALDVQLVISYAEVSK